MGLPTPTPPEVAAALVRALGLDPDHVALDLVSLVPWDSHTSLVTVQVVQVVSGTPDEVRAMLEVGQPLQRAGW
jgi:hypothetical protein